MVTIGKRSQAWVIAGIVSLGIVSLGIGLGMMGAGDRAIAAPLSPMPQSNAVAIASPDPAFPANPDATDPAVKAAIADFLTHIPADYFAIRPADKLIQLRQEQLRQERPIQLIDVREPAEFQAGHLPDAINIPLRSLLDQSQRIATDRPVVLYCSSGYRSALGIAALQMQGYRNVRGFPPSLKGWQAAHEPVVSEPVVSDSSET
jgi:rhodanese-related sulfurtransferase